MCLGCFLRRVKHVALSVSPGIFPPQQVRRGVLRVVQGNFHPWSRRLRRTHALSADRASFLWESLLIVPRAHLASLPHSMEVQTVWNALLLRFQLPSGHHHLLSVPHARTGCMPILVLLSAIVVHLVPIPRKVKQCPASPAFRASTHCKALLLVPSVTLGISGTKAI